MEAYIDSEVRKGIEQEFFAIASVRYTDMLRDSVLSMYENDDVFKTLLKSRLQIYTNLKELGLSDAAETISNYMIDDPDIADEMLATYSIVLEPAIGALRCHKNLSFSLTQRFGIRIADLPSVNTETAVPTFDRPTFPVEMGKFLIGKLAPNPTGYQGCRYLIDHYKSTDVYRLLEAFDRDVREQSKDSVIKSVSELDLVLDNIWKDASRIARSGKVINGGLKIILGLIGYGVTSALLGNSIVGGAGLLSALGLDVAKNYLSGKNIGEKAARVINKDYIVNVYDFTKKYHLSEV